MNEGTTPEQTKPETPKRVTRNTPVAIGGIVMAIIGGTIAALTSAFEMPGDGGSIGAMMFGVGFATTIFKS